VGKESSGISVIQLFTIFALMNGLKNHVIINPMLLDAAGRDAWITVLVTGLLFIGWCLLLNWMSTRSGQRPWKDWLAKSTHPVIMWILMIPIWLNLYLIGATTVIHTVTWNTTNYLPGSSAILLVLALVIICLVLSIWGVRIIAITSGILLPIVILLGIFVSLANSAEKNFQLLKPILEYGWEPVRNGMIYAAGGFSEMLLVLLLQHRLTQKLKTWQFFSYSIFTIIIMMGPILGAITEFGPVEAAKQMTSPYEQWRLVSIGQYIEHVDFFSIFQWLAGACVRVSTAVYLLIDTLPIKKSGHRICTILIVMASYILLCSIPAINDYTFYLWMYHYSIPISFYVLFSLSIIWFLITLFAKPLRKAESG
jgi:spore germination protein (amino acid permease)